jgi:uncharacterized OB-fold protein
MDTTASADPRPVPAPDDVTRFHWEATRARRLVMQHCPSCERLQYPPEVCCVRCRTRELDRVEVSGRGTIFSFAVVDRPFHVGFVDSVPYVVVIVELDEQAGLLTVANLVGAAPETSIECGMRVAVVFEERAGFMLPQFELLDTGS